MNNQLKNYIERYIELECGMQELIGEQCRTLCEQCTLCCCDAMICEEAIESPFLQKVHGAADQFTDRYGFLSTTGCSLSRGRPPACYEYFCDDHLYHQPDALHAEILRVLGALLSHATRHAQGDSPLAEIMQPEALDTLDFRRMNSQMDESFNALAIIRTFYREGSLPDEALHALRQICFSPE